MFQLHICQQLSEVLKSHNLLENPWSSRLNKRFSTFWAITGPALKTIKKYPFTIGNGHSKGPRQPLKLQQCISFWNNSIFHELFGNAKRITSVVFNENIKFTEPAFANSENSTQSPANFSILLENLFLLSFFRNYTQKHIWVSPIAKNTQSWCARVGQTSFWYKLFSSRLVDKKTLSMTKIFLGI